MIGSLPRFAAPSRPSSVPKGALFTCPRCGIRKRATREHQVYCSKPCQLAANREARGAKPTLADLPAIFAAGGEPQPGMVLVSKRMAARLRKAGA